MCFVESSLAMRDEPDLPIDLSHAAWKMAHSAVRMHHNNVFSKSVFTGASFFFPGRIYNSWMKASFIKRRGYCHGTSANQFRRNRDATEFFPERNSRWNMLSFACRGMVLPGFCCFCCYCCTFLVSVFWVRVVLCILDPPPQLSLWR